MIVHMITVLEKPVNISLSSPNSAVKQSAYNRTGNLCGMYVSRRSQPSFWWLTM